MSAEADLDGVYARSERMVGRRIAGEYVLVPIVGRGAEVDSIFNLNAVGTFVWEHLDGRRDGHSLVDLVVERFEVDRPTAEEDYRTFLGLLLSISAVARR